jgi:hypothetical protein
MFFKKDDARPVKNKVVSGLFVFNVGFKDFTKGNEGEFEPQCYEDIKEIQDKIDSFVQKYDTISKRK